MIKFLNVTSQQKTVSKLFLHSSQYNPQNRITISQHHFLTYRGQYGFSKIANFTRRLFLNGIQQLEKKNDNFVTKIYLKTKEELRIKANAQKQPKIEDKTNETKKSNNEQERSNTDHKKTQQGQQKSTRGLRFRIMNLLGLLFIIGLGNQVNKLPSAATSFLNDFKQRILKVQREEREWKQFEKQFQKNPQNQNGNEDNYFLTLRHKEISNLFDQEDSSVTKYIQAFTQNGLSTNLVQFFSDKIRKELESEQYGKTKLYLYDLKNPPRHRNDGSLKWGEGEKLRYLLQKIREKQNEKEDDVIDFLINQMQTKQPKPRGQILILNNVQLLKGIKKETLEELFKQIIDLNKNNIAKVILISESYNFYDDWWKKSKNMNNKNHKRVIFGQFRDSDLEKILKYRMNYDQIIQNISQSDESILNDIIYQIVKSNDSIQQSISILKRVNLDAKKEYYNYLAEYSFQHSQQRFNIFFQTVFIPNLKVEDKLIKARIQCETLTTSNQYNLQQSFAFHGSSHIDQTNIQNLKAIRHEKIQLLNDILKGKYRNQKARSDFNQDYNVYKQQAFRELNEEEILHGFQFVSKSKKIAFEHVVKNNPRYFSMNFFWRIVRPFID